MVTMVGTQKSFIEAIKELVELEYDAIGAYESELNNLENPDYKKSFEEFMSDHKRHISELCDFLSRCNEDYPKGPDNFKKLLVKGKVEIASMFGDQNILRATLSNEEDTNTAYGRIDDRVKESTDSKIAEVISSGLNDEKKHKKWLQSNISQKEK